MMWYSIEPRTRKYGKDMDFCHLLNMYLTKGKQLLNIGLDVLKTNFKKVVHRAAETTSEFLRNKFANKIVKQNPAIDENSRNVEEKLFNQKWEKKCWIN